MSLDIYNLSRNVIELASKWGIFAYSTAEQQHEKLLEEAEELLTAIKTHQRDDKNGVKDEIGDCIIVLINIAHMYDLSIIDCITTAWHKIKERKGSMVSGKFEKEVKPCVPRR